MLKNILFILAFFISFNANALDELSSIPKVHKKTLNTILKTFSLTDTSTQTKNDIYKKIKWALEQDNWQSYWVGNSDLSSSKFKKDRVQMYELIIVSDRSTNTIGFTYFPDANQIFYSSRQFIEGSSSEILDAYNEKKENETTKILKESDSFAFIQKKGYLNFSIYHVKSPNAAVAYIDYGLIDIK